MTKNSKSLIMYLLIIGFIMVALIFTKQPQKNDLEVYGYDDLIYDLTNDVKDDIYQISITNNDEINNVGTVNVYRDLKNINSFDTVAIPDMQSFIAILNESVATDNFINVTTNKVTSTTNFINIMTTYY